MTEKVIEGHIRPPCSKYNIFKTFKSFGRYTTLIYMYFICIVHLNDQIVHIFSAWVFKILDLRQREKLYEYVISLFNEVFVHHLYIISIIYINILLNKFLQQKSYHIASQI